MSSMLEWAKTYAQLGWQIFPLLPRRKQPATKHGVKDATADLAKIEAWWSQNPNYNIGLACGVGSGVAVVDVDVDEKNGIDGYASLKKLGVEPHATAAQETPSGGRHMVFGTAGPVGNRVGVLPGIDVRGDGGYIVLAPSYLEPYDKCPEGGSYSWYATGVPFTTELPAFPADAIAAAKKPDPTPHLTALADMSLNVDRPTLLGRASRWLACADPAVQGMGGHARLFWACQGMVNGFLLSDAEAFQLLSAEYNPRCQPPWDLSNQSEHRDFIRKIAEARKNPPRDKPLGWLVNDPTYFADTQTSTENVDWDKLLSGINQPVIATPQQELILPDDSAEIDFLSKPTGLLGRLCGWMNGGCLRPQPMLSLACSLAWLGALFGRKIEDESGLRTNIYCLGIAQSSAGKDHAPRCIRRLAEASNNLDLLGGSGLSSDTSIEERLSKAPSCLFQFDEIWELLASVKNKQNTLKAGIVTTFMKLYSSAQDIYIGREYADAEKVRTIKQPNACIYGMSTPDRFTRGLHPDEIEDGWLSRCLVFYAPERPKMLKGFKKQPVPMDIITECAEWAIKGMPPGPAALDSMITPTAPGVLGPGTPKKECEIVIATPEATAMFEEFTEEQERIEARRDENATLYMKATENAKKISLILAASESISNPVITVDIASYSIRLVRHLIKTFIDAVIPDVVHSVTEFEKRKIIKVLERFGRGGARASELSRKTQWAVDSQRKKYLADMMSSGLVYCVPDGRTVRFWAEKFAPQEVIDAAVC